MTPPDLKRWLMLRTAHQGDARLSVAPDENIKRNNDMWTHLFHTVLRRCDGEGVLLRFGPPYIVRYNDQIEERRVADYEPSPYWTPDVVFNRGGYGKYRSALKAHPNALKLYYGAGCRWAPADGIEYDLILVDTLEQLQDIRRGHPRAVSGLIIKPAAEHIFTPVECEKNYDVVFIAHSPKAFKGHAWLASKLPRGLRVLRIGEPDPWFQMAHDAKHLDVTFTGLVKREHIPALACQAKFGVAADDGRWDSGPRIIAEMLSMNLPVLVRNTVRIHHDRYVTPQTGLVADDNDFPFVAARMMATWQNFTPRDHYDRHCCLSVAAHRLLQLVSAAAKVKQNRPPEKLDLAHERYYNPDPKWDALRRRIDLIVESVHAGPVLDAGCAGGLVVRLLAERGFPVTGVDASRDILAAAEATLAVMAPAAAARITLLHGDAADIPLSPESFATVLCTETLEHVDDPLAVTLELDRLLAPGGTAILTVPHGGRLSKQHLRTFPDAESLKDVCPTEWEWVRIQIVDRWIFAEAKKPDRGVRREP